MRKPARRRLDPNRPLKSEQTRRRILEAAAKVVGKVGYAKASVARITSEAKLASGGLYYYFKTRGNLFDELLPALGKQMIEFITQDMKGVAWGLEREVRSFQSYLTYLRQYPEFYRVFSEAYVYAPKAYEVHFDTVVENYSLALRVQKAKGFLDIEDRDIVLLSYFLIGVRNYVSQLYMGRRRRNVGDLVRAVELYRRMLEGSVFKVPPRTAGDGDRPA